ncbi:MAG: 1,2-phenylacetyl-CoA epoxidase subunit PaaD [Actinomycetota bacterium]
MTAVSRAAVEAVLATVPDPEIPVVSVMDLGLLKDVVSQADHLEVEMLPTFSGCPALDTIRHDVLEALRARFPDLEIEVRWVFEPAWTTDRISEAGRQAMAGLGIAPPSAGVVMLDLGKPDAESLACPYCGSAQTRMDSAFGPTPCRSVAYCEACRNPFERFKDKG